MPLLLIYLILLFSDTCLAQEIFECAGVWRSTACDSSLAAKQISEIEVLALKEQAKKQEIVSHLNLFAAKVAKETSHYNLEVLALEQYCLRAEVKLEECQARAVKTDKSLMLDLQAHRKAQHKQLELVQRDKELAHRRNKLSAELVKRRK